MRGMNCTQPEEGITINVVSSFRTEEYQRTLFEGYLAVDPDAASTVLIRAPASMSLALP